jgi:hypothetical protein
LVNTGLLLKLKGECGTFMHVEEIFQDERWMLWALEFVRRVGSGPGISEKFQEFMVEVCTVRLFAYFRFDR